MKTPGPWRTTPLKSRVIFLLAVFFVFVGIGFAGDVIDLHHILAAGAHLVFIGTDTFAHYDSVHPGVTGMVRFSPVAHQLQATVDGDFSAPDFVVSLPGTTSFHVGELILV